MPRARNQEAAPEGQVATREAADEAREQTRERPQTERAQRVPLGSARQKLLAGTRPGYVRHWFNDVGGRIPAALQAGYEFVRKDGEATTTDMGEAISQVVGTKEGGGGLTAYLMEIREDWYREDQAKKQEAVDAVEATIRRGELIGQVGQDGRYLPKAGISIKS